VTIVDDTATEAEEVPAGLRPLEGAAPFTCPDCAFQSLSRAGYRRHRTRTHNDAPADPRYRAPRSRGAQPSAPPSTDGGDDAPETGDLGATGDEAAAAGPLEAELGHPDEGQPGQPTPAKRSWRDYLDANKRAEMRAQRPPRERKKYTGKREPLDSDAAWLYGHIGGLVVNTGGPYTPVGRVVEMQAPAFGRVFDATVAGTWPDKVLQPIIREGKKWRTVGEIVALPVMTAIAINKPELLGIQEVYGHEGELAGITMTGPLAGEYYAVWQANAVEMAKVFEVKEAKRQADFTEIRKLPMFANLPPDVDPVMFLIYQTFAPTPTPATEPEGAPAP
jgi:hypothetical protein